MFFHSLSVSYSPDIFLRPANELVLRPAHVQEDFQSRCSACPAYLRRNCSDKVSVDLHFRNDAHMQSRAKIHLVELFDWENCRKVFHEVFFHRRL